MSYENKLLPLASIPDEHHRGDVGTYLSLPRWNEFFIKEEFYRFLNENNTKNFPYAENIKNYWSFYRLSYKLTKGKSVKIFSHVKRLLSALSFTTEYFLKLVYDSCIHSLRKTPIKSQRENLIDIIHQEYLEFIKNSHWYEFDFFSRLMAYYKYKPGRDPDIGLKFTEIEKTFFLTITFLSKQFIATGIKIINSINYTQTSKTTVIELDYLPSEFENNEEINIIGEYRKHILLELPRYKGIKEYFESIRLDNNLYTIAGNQGVILVSCLFDEKIKTSLIKLAPVIMNKENSLKQIRAIYPIPVKFLPGLIKYCKNKKILIEHILEY